MANLWLPSRSKVAQAARPDRYKGRASLLSNPPTPAIAHWDFTRDKRKDWINGHDMTWFGGQPIQTEDGIYFEGNVDRYGRQDSVINDLSNSESIYMVAVVRPVVVHFGFIAMFIDFAQDQWRAINMTSDGSFQAYAFYPIAAAKSFSKEPLNRNIVIGRFANALNRRSISRYDANSNTTAANGITPNRFYVGSRIRSVGNSAAFQGWIESITIYDGYWPADSDFTGPNNQRLFEQVYGHEETRRPVLRAVPDLAPSVVLSNPQANNITQTTADISCDVTFS